MPLLCLSSLACWALRLASCVDEAKRSAIQYVCGAPPKARHAHFHVALAAIQEPPQFFFVLAIFLEASLQNCHIFQTLGMNQNQTFIYRIYGVLGKPAVHRELLTSVVADVCCRHRTWLIRHVRILERGVIFGYGKQPNWAMCSTCTYIAHACNRYRGARSQTMV